MAPKRKYLALSHDEALPDGNPTSSSPIIHKPVAWPVKAGSDTSSGLSTSKRVAPRVSSSQPCLDEQSNYASSAPRTSPSKLPPDDFPSPHTATEAVQRAGQAETTTADVSPPAAIKLSRSFSQTSSAQADNLIQAPNDSTGTSVNRLRFALTKQNLRIFTGAGIADHPVTPSRSASNTGPGIMNNQKATNVRNMRMALKANGMPLEDPNIKGQHPQVHQFAAEIVNCERNSPVRPGWKENFHEQRNESAARNENTWTRKIWTALQNPERNVRQRDGEGSMLEEKGWEAVAWNKSGLDDNWDQPLHADSLPRLEPENENQCALLESLPRVSTPTPNIAFGFNRKVFDDDEMLVNSRYHMYVQVSEGIYHPWFLVETKANATMEELEIQCCLGGAAFVRCTRYLMEDHNPDGFVENYGPDLESIAFSLALVPSCAHIYYHWANRYPGGGVLYHMHFLKSFALRDEDSCVALLRAVNNILDWGLDARLTFITELLDKIRFDGI